MVRNFLTVLTVILLASPMAHGRSVSGVNIPETLKAGKTTLVLNGAGVREKFFVDVYVSALYLKKKSTNAAAILNGNEVMAVRLHITSGLITGDKMSEATNEGFEKSTGGKTAPLRSRIDRFIAVFKAGIKKNDYYDIIYFPGQGIKVYKNGVYKTTTKGLDMKKALFGIWIGPRPPQKNLKKHMLGR